MSVNDTQGGAPAEAVASQSEQVESNPSEALEAKESEGQEQEASEAAPEEKLTKAEIKRIKKLQLKIDGKEFDEELPFEVPEEHAEYMKKHLQMSKAAQKRFQEASALENEVKDFVKALKGDTRNVLKQMGIDPKDFARQVIEDEMKRAQMSPEELKRMELEEELKKLREERKKEQEDLERERYSALEKQELERIDMQMTKALESSDLPKSPYVVKKMAEYMSLGLQNGIELTADEVLPIVREEIYNDLQALIQSLSEDKVESFIGKDVLSKIRKRNVAKARTTPATVKAGVKDVAAKTEAPKQAEKVSMKTFFKI